MADGFPRLLRLHFDDYRVLVAPAIPALNSAYAKEVEERGEQYSLAVAAKALGGDTALRILAEIYVASVIQGWEEVDPPDPVSFLLERPDDLVEIGEHATNTKYFLGGHESGKP